MLADSEILSFPKVSLKTKELLPEYSGIYYVVDENKVVCYVGKAINIRKRWLGKSHHRIYQLKQLKHKYFDIYYENINLSELDQREKQQIAKYTPHLNNSPVKSKKVRPTETLLRETIAKISDFAFILGVEAPRREVKDKISVQWLIQEQILDIPIIHMCLDLITFKALFNPHSADEHIAIITKAFSTRKTYASKWESFLKGYLFMLRLSVNGYIIEFNDLKTWIGRQDLENHLNYNQTKIAQESIRTVTSESLFTIQNLSYTSKNQVILPRIKPYTSDLIPLFFNESIDIQNLKQELQKVSCDYKSGKRGIGSRSKVVNIDSLLTSREINTSKYPIKQVNYLSQDRMGIYVQCFSVDLKTSPHYGTFAKGIIKNKETKQLSSQFEIVYLLASVDKKAWLLVEEYLKDFAKAATRLNNGEGYVEKFYISRRKYIVSAKVNIKLESIGYSAWIPFGMNEKYPTFETAKEEIKKRLHEANLPRLKLSFKRESIAK